MQMTTRHTLQENTPRNGQPKLLVHNDVRTTMFYTHVLNRGGKGVKSTVDSR